MIYFNNLFQNLCTVRETRQGNNPHAFLEIFRATAEMCRWPKEWSLGLLLLQSGRAQAVALSLPTATRCRFAGVHRAIMDGLGLAQEGYRQRLWEGQMGLKDWTFTYARWLSVVAAWWLQPGAAGGEARIMEQVVLELFTAGLSAETAGWVRCHHPAGMDAVVTLAGDSSLYNRGRQQSCHGWSLGASRFQLQGGGSGVLQHHSRLLLWGSEPQVDTALVPSATPHLAGATRASGQTCWRYW